MKEIIQNLLHSILSEDWEVRADALAQLMTQSDPQSVTSFSEILDKNSELQCIYFCQFLGKTLFSNAIDYLIPFLSDERERVQQEAIWAFDRYIESEKIEEKKKVVFLIQALQKAGERGKTYAAECFGKYSKHEGVPYLIEALESTSAKVRLQAIESLRQIGDLNAVSYIARCLHDKDFHIRYAACFALGEFKARPFWRNILPLLNDEKMTVRQAAVWTISRVFPKKSIKYIVHRLETDTSPLVRIEAAKRLGKIPSTAVVAPLLTCLTHDKDQNVRSAANYSLDNLDNKIKIKIFKKNLKMEDPQMKIAVMHKMAFTKTREAYNIIYKIFKKNEKNPQIRATCCECFGILENLEALPLLKKAIYDHPVIAYSAVRALAAILGDEEKKLITSLLQEEKIGDVQKQTILQFILKKVTDGRLYLDAGLSELLKKLIISSNVNTSYLAIRIVAASSDFSAVLPILETSQKTKDQEHKKKCLSSIETILHGDPVHLLRLLQQKFISSQLKNAVFECLKIFNAPEKQKLSAVLGALEFYLTCEKDEKPHMLSFISRTVKKAPHIILQILYQTKWPEAVAEDMLFILDEVIEPGNPENILLNIKPIESFIHSDQEKLRVNHPRVVAIRLLEKIGQSDAIQKLVELYHDEKDERVKKYTKAAIRTIVHRRIS